MKDVFKLNIVPSNGSWDFKKKSKALYLFYFAILKFTAKHSVSVPSHIIWISSGKSGHMITWIPGFFLSQKWKFSEFDVCLIRVLLSVILSPILPCLKQDINQTFGLNEPVLQICQLAKLFSLLVDWISLRGRVPGQEIQRPSNTNQETYHLSVEYIGMRQFAKLVNTSEVSCLMNKQFIAA